MKKRMIRLLCAAGVLAAMACGAWALTSPDGLVSLSYLNNTFIPSAVEKGTISQERLDQSVLRILQLKEKYDLI